MAEKIEYNGTGDGINDKGIHFSDIINDYTLCGLTLDGDTLTAGGFDSTNKKVDCEDCIKVVMHFKKIKSSEMIKI